MKSHSTLSGTLLCVFLASQCWADTTAHAPSQDAPVQRGRSDAYYSCLETLENAEIPQEFLDTVCGTLGETTSVLKTSAYCGLANNLLERCFESTGGAYQPDGGRYNERPYEDNRQRPYNGGTYNGQPNVGQPYNEQPYDRQPYNEQPYDGQQYDGQPYDGQPYDGQPDNGQPYNGQPNSGQPDNGQPNNGQPNNGQPYYEQPGNDNPRVRGSTV